MFGADEPCLVLARCVASCPPIVGLLQCWSVAVCVALEFPHDACATAVTNGDMVAIGLDLGMTRR